MFLIIKALLPMILSPNLNLPYIQAAQAQKHITHNEALRALDVLVQLCVLAGRIMVGFFISLTKAGVLG